MHIRYFPFKFFVFLMCNEVYFEHTQRYKKDCNQQTEQLYI